MSTRQEEDFFGKTVVPSDRLWGPQTQRSLDHFKIGTETFSRPFIKAMGITKKAAAIANHEFGIIDESVLDLIIRAADEVIEGKLDGHFPVVVWQTGSGTHTNMNVNEVIANRSNMIDNLKNPSLIHAIDHVNLSQSSNDCFPTFMHIATMDALQSSLLPSLRRLAHSFDKKGKEFDGIIKIGRTHLMDATPISVSQEFSGYEAQLNYCIDQVERTCHSLSKLALGGTAVGTGLNSPKGFSEKVAKIIAELTGYPFQTAANKFMAIAAHDAMLSASSSLRHIATVIMKIASDIRILASGPRCGIYELILPVNEPGSSMMPGKTNPTQCEVVTMVAAQVIGNDVAVTIGGMGGQLELNTFKPLIAHNVLHSVQLITDVIHSFVTNCVLGIQINMKRVDDNLNNSLMLVTALSPKVGYDTASKIARHALKHDKTLKQSCLELMVLSAEEYDEIIQPEDMISPYWTSEIALVKNSESLCPIAVWEDEGGHT